MFLILIVHADFFSIGKPDKQDILASPISSFMRIEIESLALVCVNVYILISGYFGINLKAKSIGNFLFQVLFYSGFIYIITSLLGYTTFSPKLLIITLASGYSSQWFIPVYIMLLLLSPILNSFVQKASQSDLTKFIISFYIVQTLFGWCYPFWNIFMSGYSVISFIGLYFIGRYMKLYPPQFTQYKKGLYLLGYLLITSIAALISLLTISYSNDADISGWVYSRLMPYASPFVIICSICLLLFFSKLKVQSKIINRIALSAFSVYLIHCHPNIVNFYKEFSKYLFDTYDTIDYILYISAFIIGVFLTSILIDQIRILLWKFISNKMLKP